MTPEDNSGGATAAPPEEDFAVPIPIQTFLWRQTCPFIRPKLGKLHEATCVSLEKVLVQNILFGLSPSLTEAIKNIPRWRLIQTSFPHVMHCTAQLLTNRKLQGIQSGLGSSETKLLYTLHWILLDSAEECADADYEKRVVPAGPFNYLFPISAVTLFVYLFAPLCNQLKMTDFNNFRMENGYRVWPNMWSYKSPDPICFTCPVKPKQPLDPFFVRKTKKEQYGDVFVGATGARKSGPDNNSLMEVSAQETAISTPPPTPEHAKTDYSSTNLVLEKELEKLAGPACGAETASVPFPETIPEESSSNDEEHVMIFRLGSIPESEGMREGTIFKMSVRQSSNESHKASPADKSKERKGSNEYRPRTDSSPRASIAGRTTGSGSISQAPKTSKATTPSQNVPAWKNPRLATYMDVAVLRCLFIAHWEEEGVFWGLSYLLKRMEELVALKNTETEDLESSRRQRSNSLPSPALRSTGGSTDSSNGIAMPNEKSRLKSSLSAKTRSGTSKDMQQFGSYSACSSPTTQRRQRSSSQRRGSERGGKRKLTVFDFKTFVETKLLSKSDKMLEKSGTPEGSNGVQVAEEHSDQALVRTRSAMGHGDELDKKAETMSESYFSGESNLYKGKSMPSLRYIGVATLSAERKPERSMFPNPIITVTEHTPAPTPSPERMRVSSLESHLNSILQNFIQEKRQPAQVQRSKLTRSTSDTNISYTVSDAAEAPGTALYIKHNGEINVKVIIKALHRVCARDAIIKSVRISQVALQLLDIIYDHVEKDDEVFTVIETITRTVTGMGCTHGCGDAQRCNTSDSVRSHGNNLLLRLSIKFRVQFAKFYENFVMTQSVSTIIDFFHALCSFCVDPSSLLSPLNPRIKDFYASYSTGMEGSTSKVECQIFKSVLKKLVSRLANMSKELRSSENMALYCDVRNLISYIYENDGNSFRKVALSALIDSAERPNTKEEAKTHTSRIVRQRQNYDETQSYYVMDETGNNERTPSSTVNNKKYFFKKKSSSSTCASMGETENITGESPSGTLTRKHATLTPKSSEIDLVNSRKGMSTKKESRLVSWLTKGSGGDKSFDMDVDDSALDLNAKSTRRQATIVQKAKKRVEERLKRIKIKRESTNDDNTGGGISRRGSLENVNSDHMVGDSNEFVVLKERRLVDRETVRDGLLRFGFLLEITHPGSLPDAHLMAALLDLPQTVVVARASVLLECCFLVHACNRGHWPLWMKLPVFRPSCAGISKAMGGPRSKSYGLQKAAGKMFQQWGEALNARLEEFIQSNAAKMKAMDLNDDAKQKELAQRDEEEDFLDEASISDGFDCPMALQILACMLLYEITAFLRETYQSLPKSGVVGKAAPAAEKEVKPPTTAATGGTRRWSYGLSSSMGQSQASHSLQSISDPHAAQQTGERKISFVLNDNESSEGQEKHQPPGEQDGKDEKGKKARPLLLRRGTPGGQSSFRRRSIKLQQRAGKKDQDGDSMKRSDSLTSGKRKVSSISDDTSEQNSGDESPGVNSNEDNPPDEDTVYMPWLSTVIEFLSSLHFRCMHQGYCHPQCPRRLMRAVSRLLKAVRKVYGEEFGISSSDVPGCDFDKEHDRAKPEESLIVKYIRNNVQGGFHSMVSLLVKSASTLTDEQFVSLIPSIWELLLEPDIQINSSSAALFILAGVKVPEQVKARMQADFEHQNPTVRINAMLRFQTLWRCRHQVWPRMEESSNFKAPPPGIEFTLPSPRIGVECIPVIDPPWTPQTKAKVEEMTLNQDKPHVSRRYLVTATKTRKTQQAELVKMALQAEEDRKKNERELFLITTVPTTVLASYEPSSHHAVGEDEPDDEGQNVGPGTVVSASGGVLTSNLTGGAGNQSNVDGVTINTGLMMSKGSHHKGVTLFPSSLCSAAIYIVQLLHDPAVTLDGNSVYEVAYHVLWHCLVEDSSLFLRYIFEKLTRGKHEVMFKVLRHLIMFVPRLPQQAAFSLYNHIIGFIMFHTRSPQDSSSEMIGSALSVLWMVVHSVQGIMFKDLKQILRKEQCDASILLTANIPAAKKIVVHGPLGPEAGGIPTQFPVQEDTQFVQILRESVDFFSIDEEHHREYFLVDHKTHQIHSQNSYVRDFYFFSRSQHPQLSLVHMAPDHAYNALQRQSFILKFLESGKVTLTWAILKNVDQVMQRVVFLHEELMKLPAFPRKALESEMDITRGGQMGRELLGIDVLHKFMWTKLITRMFEAMSGNFAYSGDIHLFINVLSGSLMVHSEDATIIRYVTAAFINAAQQFKNIFSTNGYLLIMPPLLLTYCNHQSNPLVTGSIEFACKEFYLLHRKPFVLQMFGALAALLDTDELAHYGDPRRVPSKCLFRLLLSLETPTPDPLHITELIHGPQPLRPLDFCYHDDSDEITVLDCISMCVCVVAYASDSLRGHQMLTILEAVLPPYLMHIQTNKTEGKTERDVINHIAVAMKTLVNNCEPLAKNYSGPQMYEAVDLRGSSQRNYASKSGLRSPAGYDFADDDSHSKYMSDHSKNKSAYERDAQDSEVIREEFRRPRDTLLSLVSDFYSKSSSRLIELSKKGGAEAKPVELLDIKSHVRLSEVAISLLKVSPYDPATMGCRGLQRYMVEVFPFGEWSHETARPALIAFLRRMDKTFAKICKKTSIRRHTDWEAAAGLLKGIYQTLWRHPYIVHMQHLKSLIQTCQCLLMGEGQASELGLSSAGAALMGKIPPTHFCSTVVRLLALQVRALGETYSMEQACGLQASLPALQERSDVLLMNLLLPLCLRVGSGRKDVPKMRKSDIVFILNVILSNINASPRLKGANDTGSASAAAASGVGTGATRSGSVTERKIKQSTCQIAFLGLKILCICFDTELSTEWPRTARAIHELANRSEGGAPLWDFLEFITTVRTSIFALFRPLIMQKMSKPPTNDQERQFQFAIREKLRCATIGRCKGSILVDIAHQMKQLKEELEVTKEVVVSRKNLNVEPAEVRSRPRPSLSELFPGLAARFGGSDESKGSTATIHKGLNRESSVRVKTSAQGRMMDRFMRRVSIAGDAPFTIPENAVLKSKDRSEETLELHSERPEMSEGACGTVEEEPKQHRLQRQKFQSRKTFRFRKSRKGNLEQFSSIDMEEESQGGLESPSSPSLKEELLLRKDEYDDKSNDSSKSEKQSKSSLKVCSSKRRTSTSPNGGDCESQNSFSRTSSTCGYRESFGSVERYSLQMLERLEVQPPDNDSSERESSSRSSRPRYRKKGETGDDEDTLI